MKVLLSWLKDYVDIELSALEVAEILSNRGFPYEGIEQLDNDAIIDVEVTSNRGDCLGYIGVARELAAATGKKLKLPKVELAESSKPASEFASVEICEPGLCPRYTARIIEESRLDRRLTGCANGLRQLGCGASITSLTRRTTR